MSGKSEAVSIDVALSLPPIKLFRDCYTAGKGIYGPATAENLIQRIGDLHDFPDYIVRVTASNAETVVPIIIDERVVRGYR